MTAYAKDDVFTVAMNINKPTRSVVTPDGTNYIYTYYYIWAYSFCRVRFPAHAVGAFFFFLLLTCRAMKVR